MIEQLGLGSLIVCLSVCVQVGTIALMSAMLRRAGDWMMRPPIMLRIAVALVLITLGLMAAHSVNVWLWAVVFLWLEIFPALEPALYFSIVSFTTLGFGDVLLPEEWRLLGGISAANGLLIFGLSTAYLVEFLRRLRHAEGPSAPFGD